MPVIEFEPKIEGEVRRIEESDDLTPEDREVLLDYKRDMEADGLSSGRIFKVLIHTRSIAERLGEKNLTDATKEDIKKLVAWINGRDLAESTKSDYKKIIKRFYKWENGGEYPEKVGWIKTTVKQNKKKLPEKLLTEDDVKRLVDAAKNPRDRALINVMWETGARPSEYLDLKVGDVEDRKNGRKILISGKTGPRRLPLISSVPHLTLWMNQHPANGDPDAPLWCKLNGRPAERIDYNYFRNLLKRIAKRAGVNKPVFPYQFRHSRATFLANWLTEAQMCEYFGWVQGSDRPATYVHLSGRDIDHAYDKIHGLVDKEEDKAKLSSRKCPRCGEIVGAEGKYCQRCGLTLDLKTALEQEEKAKITDSIIARVLEDPEFKRELEERVIEAAREVVSRKWDEDDGKNV